MKFLESQAPKARSTKLAIFLASIVALYFYHLLVISQHLVNVPLWDEWDNFPPRHFEWRWVVGFFNEHRILYTRLLLWIFGVANGLDYRSLVVANFLIFGLFLVVYARVMKWAVADRVEAWRVWIFFPFLLSPVSHQVFDWGINSSFIFAPFFSVLGTWWLFRSEVTRWRSFGAAWALASAAFSISGGLVMVVGIVSVYIAMSLFHARRRAAAMAGMGLILLVLAWSHGYPASPQSSTYTAPWHANFWRFFSLFSAQILGFKSHSVFLCALAALICAVPPLCLLPQIFRTRPSTPDTRSWAILALATGFWLSFLAVTMGRGSEVDAAKSSRYAFWVSMALPVVAAALQRAACFTSRRQLFTWMLFAVTFVGYVDTWRFKRHYSPPYEARIQGLGCLREKLSSANLGLIDCPTLFPVPLGARLREARALDLSFTRELNQRETTTPGI